MTLRDPLALVLFSATFACSGTPQDTVGCGQTHCGCSEDVTVQFEATIWHAQDDVAIAGAEVTCLTESSPRATSDAEGVAGFTLETTESPGCGYQDCNNLVIHVPDSALVDQELSFYEANGATILMQYGPD